MNKQYLGFVYNGVCSNDMGVIQASSSSGLFDEELTSSNTVKLEKVGDDKFHFFGVDRDTITFDLTLYFEHDNRQRFDEMIDWLKCDEPKSFYFLEREERVVYCLVDGNIKVEHNGNMQGFLTMTMRTNSPYYYSPIMEYGLLTTNTGFSNTKSISIRNDGHFETDVLIKIDTATTSNNGKFQVGNYLQTFKVNTLEKGSVYTIDSANGYVTKDNKRVFNLDVDPNSEFITLRPQTTNYLTFNTDYPCKVNLYYQFKYKI